MYIYIICKIVKLYMYARILKLSSGRGEQRGKVDMPQQRGKSGKVKRGSRGGGGGGAGGSGPPGKSQVIWGSIGNKQLDPLPGRSWTPTLKKLDPFRNLEK